jgi:hypothetical protein
MFLLQTFESVRSEVMDLGHGAQGNGDSATLGWRKPHLLLSFVVTISTRYVMEM